MNLRISETRTIEFEIELCVCGNEADVNYYHVHGYTYGASIKCNCGLTISETSSAIGYGVTSKMLCQKVVDKWNKSMSCHSSKTRKEQKADG